MGLWSPPGGASVRTACPPNWLRIAATAFIAGLSSCRDAKRANSAAAIAAALFARFASRQEDSPAMKAVAAMRNQFGGHAIQADERPSQDKSSDEPPPSKE